MHSLSLSSSSSTLLPSRLLSLKQTHLQTPKLISFSNNTSRYRTLSVSSSTAPTQETIDFHEKDWSFLESMEVDSSQKIIEAGQVTDSSRVLVSFSSEAFVDSLMEVLSPTQLLVIVHDSLFLLACVKEKYDKVKCWQGELIYVPEKWSDLDVVFLYFLPCLPFGLDDVFKTLSQRCSLGGRVVISHPQGREGLKVQKEEYSDVVVSDLPDESTLKHVAKRHSFEVIHFVDEQGFYLAVLKCSK